MNQFFVSRYFKVTFSVIGIIFLFNFTSSCAYKLSNKIDTLPKNTKVLFIPVFKNSSSEPLVENFFTDSMRSETLRSGYAQVANSEQNADAVLIGTIQSVEIMSSSDDSVIEAKKTDYLPNGTVLTYRTTITVTVDLKLKKKGSSDVLWTGSFTQAKSYKPPQLTLPTINSANNLYNLSASRQTLSTLSKEMMQLAFDRMVDNF